MSIEGQKIYPGDEATPQQVLQLADEYRRAAVALQTIGRRRKPLSRAPYRLAAIHAIELYLNALLMACGGYSSAKLRSLHHDLAQRRVLAARVGLQLRKRTADHLEALSKAREYLVMRYGPEMSAKVSQLNRLEATLDEIAEKVSASINSKRS